MEGAELTTPPFGPQLRGNQGDNAHQKLQIAIATIFPGKVQIAKKILRKSRGNESIYLHRSGPLLENGLDRPERISMVDTVLLVFPAFPYLP